MQLRTPLESRILFLGTALIFASGCSEDAPGKVTNSPPVDVGQPPAAPENAALPDGPGATFAISKLKLGANNPNGTIDRDVWKTIGYNLDHTVTTITSAGVMIGEDVCSRVDGADFSQVVDGNEGRDNGFGSTLMPIIQVVNQDAEKSTNDLVRLGKYTLLVDVQGLGDSQTYQSLSARIYEGRSFVDAQGMPAAPLFDGTDVWPVALESVTNGALEKPLAITTNAYLAEEGEGGTFVAHFDGSVVLKVDVFLLPNEQGVIWLRIHDPLVTLRLSADRLRVESGTLAGVLDAGELDKEVARLLGMFDPTLCGTSPTAFAIRQQVRQSSDILRSGEKEKSKPCDAISIGVEFEATRAQLGMVTGPIEPLPDPCADP